MIKAEEISEIIKRQLQGYEAEVDLKEAGEEQRKLVEGARAEAARLVESARNEMAQDVRRACQELRQEVADLATTVAERLIRKSLRDEDHRRIVQDAIARVDKVN